MSLISLPTVQQPTVTRYEPTALLFAAGTSYEEWAAAGMEVRLAARAGLWWLGDWIIFGTMTFGDEHVTAQVDPSDLALGEGTIRAAQWVSEKIPPAHRRPELSWSHHREVAALPPSDRDRLLEAAVRDGYSTKELREVVRSERPPLPLDLDEPGADAEAEPATSGAPEPEDGPADRTGDAIGATYMDESRFPVACELRFGMTLGRHVVDFVRAWTGRNARAAARELDL